jgi:predicted permease
MKRFFRLPWRTRRHISSDVATELSFHIETRTARLIALGHAPDAAREQAMREFGDVDDARRYIEQVDRQTEQQHQRRELLGDLRQDFTYAIRSLRHAPAFTVAVLVTLAIGIGANTAVFNLVNALLIKPPQILHPQDVAWVTPITREGQSGAWTMPDVVTYRKESRSWSQLSAFAYVNLTLNSGEPTRLQGLAVNGNYFDMVGIRPALGRGFLGYEDVPDSPVLSIVISHALWQSRFGGDSAIVGRQVQINGETVTIVGVAPDGFSVRLGDRLDFWMPFPAVTRMRVGRANMYANYGARWLRVLGRRAPNLTIDAVQSEARVIEARLEPRVTKPEQRRRLDVVPVRGALEPSTRARILPVLTLIMLVPLLVLCVACANVANLYVSRGVLRQRELAVRRALGASRGRLVRQLLTECAVLGFAAGILGIGASYALTDIIARLGTFPREELELLAPDWRSFGVTFAVALAAVGLFGLLPALTATRSSITIALKNVGIAMRVGRGRHRLRSAFVVSQVALSLSLLITAGLFVGSLRKALHVDPGYDPTNVIAATYDLSGQRYTAEQLQRFDAALLERVTSMPAVEAAAVAEMLPLSGSTSSTNLRRESEAPDAQGHLAFSTTVSPGYFEAMRIPLVRGRAFGRTDNESSPRVMVVNERLAALLWPGADPIGQRVRSPVDSGFVVVVGVARDGKYKSLMEPAQSAFWLSSSQYGMTPHAELVVRSRAGEADAIAAAREALRAMDPTLPIGRIQSLEAYIAETVDGQRSGAALLAVFGAIALALAAFGIFGVIAQGVAARTREIGIRMSLGARAGDVVSSFVREGLGLTVIGATGGVLLSLAVSKMLSALLFGLEATDVLTFTGASLAIVVVATLASFVPARRAAKVDPLVALRSD